ncbi:MAG: hypothetical protein WDW38_000201 [Sanguina aurantia]
MELGQAQGLIRENLILMGEGFKLGVSFYGSDYVTGSEQGYYGLYYNLDPYHGWYHPDTVGPKPSAAAYAAMTYLLEGHHGVQPVTGLGSTAIGYAYARPGSSVVVYDWMGNGTPVQTKNGVLTVDLSKDPVYVTGVSPAVHTNTMASTFDANNVAGVSLSIPQMEGIHTLEDLAYWKEREICRVNLAAITDPRMPKQAKNDADLEAREGDAFSCIASQILDHGRAAVVDPLIAKQLVRMLHVETDPVLLAHQKNAEHEQKSLLIEFKVKVGSIVEVCDNYDKSDGLFNGACGVVKHVSCTTSTPAHPRPPAPFIIWVQFDDPTIGRRPGRETTAARRTGLACRRRGRRRVHRVHDAHTLPLASLAHTHDRSPPASAPSATTTPTSADCLSASPFTPSSPQLPPTPPCHLKPTRLSNSPPREDTGNKAYKFFRHQFPRRRRPAHDPPRARPVAGRARGLLPPRHVDGRRHGVRGLLPRADLPGLFLEGFKNVVVKVGRLVVDEMRRLRRLDPAGGARRRAHLPTHQRDLRQLRTHNVNSVAKYDTIIASTAWPTVMCRRLKQTRLRPSDYAEAGSLPSHFCVRNDKAPSPSSPTPAPGARRGNTPLFELTAAHIETSERWADAPSPSTWYIASPARPSGMQRVVDAIIETLQAFRGEREERADRRHGRLRGPPPRHRRIGTSGARRWAELARPLPRLPAFAQDARRGRGHRPVRTNAIPGTYLLEMGISVFSDHAPLTLVVYKKETPPLSNQWPAVFPPIAPPHLRAPVDFVGLHTLTVDTDTAPFNVPAPRDRRRGTVLPPTPTPRPKPQSPPTPPSIKPLELLGLYGLSVPDAFDTLTHAADSIFDSVAFSLNVGLTGPELREAAVDHMNARRAADLSYETALRVLYCTCATDAPVCPCVTTRMARMAYAFTAAPLGQCLDPDDMVIGALSDLLHLDLYTISYEEGAVVSVYEGAGSNGRRRYLLHYTLEHCYRPLRRDPPVDAQFTLDVFPVIRPDALL